MSEFTDALPPEIARKYLVRHRHPWRGALPRKNKMHEIWALVRWPFYAQLLRRNCGWRHIGWALWESTETAGEPSSDARYASFPGPTMAEYSRRMEKIRQRKGPS